HRLWHAPETMARTYDPGNFAITIEQTGKSVVFTAPKADPAGILKSIEIEPLGNESFKVTHRITNMALLWPVKIAPWALSVMKRGGYATLPLPPKGEHPRDLLPSYHIVPWSYTDLSYPQWQFKSDYIGVDTTHTDV